MNTFYIPKIETRTIETDGVRQYIVKGYATVPNHIYPYQRDDKNLRSFREFFTERCMENLKRKAQKEKIFVDIGHTIGTKLNVESVMKEIQQKTGFDFSQEKELLMKGIKGTDLPMFKLEDLKIDENGIFVDIRGNPFYRMVDEEHRAYFDATWNSLENGFINGMSINFKPTEFFKVNDNLTQIDDMDLYGISLASGVANDMASITEVAMRCVEKVRGELKCQTTSLLM